MQTRCDDICGILFRHVSVHFIYIAVNDLLFTHSIGIQSKGCFLFVCFLTEMISSFSATCWLERSNVNSAV